MIYELTFKPIRTQSAILTVYASFFWYFKIKIIVLCNWTRNWFQELIWIFYFPVRCVYRDCLSRIHLNGCAKKEENVLVISKATVQLSLWSMTDLVQFLYVFKSDIFLNLWEILNPSLTIYKTNLILNNENNCPQTLSYQKTLRNFRSVSGFLGICWFQSSPALFNQICFI